MKGVLAFFAGAAFLILGSPSFADNSQYAILVDAGSSGSRIHLFQYDKTLPVPGINDIFSENDKPGLSSFSEDPTDAGRPVWLVRCQLFIGNFSESWRGFREY